MRKSLPCILLPVLLSTGGVRAGQESRYVNDGAGVMTQEAFVELTRFLEDFENKTTWQMRVFTVNSLGGESMEDFSLKLAEKHGFGKKGVDNGVLVVIAVQDRKYRIETGYGAEAVLPDGVAGSIARQQFVPYFKAGDFSTGILTGVKALARRVVEREGVSSSSRQSGKAGPAGAGAVCACFSALLPFIILIAVLSGLRRRRAHSGWSWAPYLLTGMLLGGGRHRHRSFGGGRFGGGGGGFGGGGFGSFGGGGGGGFGGGGASGGW